MKTEKDIKRLMLRGEIKTDPPTREKILAGAFAELEPFAGGKRPLPRRRFYQGLMTSRIAQLAAAAGLVAAVFITAHYIGRPVQICSVALAQVAQNIDNVHTFTYRYYQQVLNDRAGRAGKTETVFYVSPDYGVRLGTYVDGKSEMQTFILPAEKVKITVLPEEKHYTRDALTEQAFGQAQRENDPRELIRQFLSFDYTDLGCSEIGGIECRGIEVSNPGFLRDSLRNVVGRLWVNVKTQLPVRMELEGTDIATLKRVRIVTDEFRWEAGLQRDDFGPFIPEDYVLEEPEGAK